MTQAGGTSAPETRSWAPLGGFVIAAVAAAFLVHRISAGDTCGWSYGSVGGACRAIILLSLLSGLVCGALAAGCASAIRNELSSRAWSFGIAAVVVVVLGTLAAKQFQDYRMAGLHEMDDRMCTFATNTLPDCVKQVWGEDAAAKVRRAQPGCMADDRSIATYAKCMPIVDCKQVVDCVANAP